MQKKVSLTKTIQDWQKNLILSPFGEPTHCSPGTQRAVETPEPRVEALALEAGA